MRSGTLWSTFGSRNVALRNLSALAFTATLASQAAAAPVHDIRINDTDVFPESLSATRDGSVYVGSIKGIVFRAAPGSQTAEPWIRPSVANGILSILGVLADAKSRTLWICSAPSPLRNPPAVGVTSLMAFSLTTGAQKGVYPFPSPGGACNDITISPDGSVFSTDTPNGRILMLKPGGMRLELFAADDRLKGVDGIVFGASGTLYVNIVSRGLLMRVERGHDGATTGLTELTLSQPVAGPDGFRLIAGNRFLLAEGASGRIDEVVIEGDSATIKVLKEGLISPSGVTRIGGAAYGLEGKILYLIDPKLKGQDPGPFVIRAIPLGPKD